MNLKHWNQRIANYRQRTRRALGQQSKRANLPRLELPAEILAMQRRTGAIVVGFPAETCRALGLRAMHRR